MIPIEPHIHQEIKGPAVSRMLAPYRCAGLFVFRHAKTGAVVLAQRAGRSGLMRELHIFKDWPRVSPHDSEQLSFMLEPNVEKDAESMHILKHAHDTQMKLQHDNGYWMREFYRRRAYDCERKHGNSDYMVKVPNLGE